MGVPKPRGLNPPA